MQEKILVLDIDGTLTNSKKEITEATKRGIWNILQHGHKVILASSCHLTEHVLWIARPAR